MQIRANPDKILTALSKKITGKGTFIEAGTHVFPFSIDLEA